MNKDLLKELESEHSILAKLPKHYYVDEASVPKGYLKNVQKEILNHITSLPHDAEKSANVSSGNSYSLPKIAWGMAAVLLVGVFVTLFYLNIGTSDSSYVMNLSQTEMINYLESEEIYDPTEARLLSQEMEENIDLDDLSKEEIEAYLIENELLDPKSIETI